MHGTAARLRTAALSELTGWLSPAAGTDLKAVESGATSAGSTGTTYDHSRAGSRAHSDCLGLFRQVCVYVKLRYKLHHNQIVVDKILHIIFCARTVVRGLVVHFGCPL